MRKGSFLFFFVGVFSSLFCEDKQAEVESFFRKYPERTYQDIIVDGQVRAKGTNICSTRYDLISPIFASFKRPFKVLEIGAAQGYFSFRIARDFPEARLFMIDEDSRYYAHHGSMLRDLCHLNSHLSNIYLLRKHLTLSDLQHLSSKEHFDVILLFLVIHQMTEDFHEQLAIFDTLCKMTDNLLIEVADDAAPHFTNFIEALSTKQGCANLGVVKRFNDPNAPHLGKMFWFKIAKDHDTIYPPTIQESTFREFSGVFPAHFR